MGSKEILGFVVYFNHRMGAPHAVLGLKSFIFALKPVFSYFSVTNRKKKKNQRKAIQKGGLPACKKELTILVYLAFGL